MASFGVVLRTSPTLGQERQEAAAET